MKNHPQCRRRIKAVMSGVPLALITCLWLVSFGASAAEEEPAATPFRPSVANGADLSRPGWLELEFGVQSLGGKRTDRRDSLPYLLKLAFNENWGVLLGGEVRIRLAPEGGDIVRGAGDTVITLKHRLPFSRDDTAFGVEASVKRPTAKGGLGSGKTDYALNGIYSADLVSGAHLDLNLGATRLGAAEIGQGRTQIAWAVAVAHPVAEVWSLVLDLSGSYQRGTPSTAQLLGAASYSLSKRVVLDAGLAVGLNHASPKWTVFSGVTVLLGQLF